MIRKGFLWSILLAILISLLALSTVSYGQIDVLVRNGKNYGKIILKDGKLTVAKNTEIEIIRQGGILDNLDGIKKGNITYQENFSIIDNQGKSYNISRTLIANKKGISVDKIKVTDDKGKVLELEEIPLGNGYYIDLNQRVLAPELEVKRRILPVNLSIILILGVGVILLLALLIYLFKRRKMREDEKG